MKRQSKNKFKPTKINLALYALFFLIILLIFGKILKLTFSLNQPITPEYALKNNNWNPQNTINIVIKSTDISVLSLDPQDKKITLISLPGEAYTQVVMGFGSWPISSIFALGQEEKPGFGAVLLKQSVSNLLGLPIERIIELTGESAALSSNQLIDKLHKNWYQIFGLSKQIKTDLTLIEAWNLVSTINQIRSDKTNYLSLANTNITESRLLPDSTRILGVNTVNLDLFIRDKLTDPKITKEGYQIAVFNGTIHPGLALGATRVLTNLGANVITTQNTEKPVLKSALITIDSDKDSLGNSYSYLKLAELFVPECKLKLCSLDDPKVTASRGQIILVLGEDYYLKNYHHD